MMQVKSAARALLAWLRSRRAVLLYFLAFVGILFFVYSLYRLPIGTAVYTALLGTVTGLCLATSDFVRFCGRHRALEKLAGRFPLGQMPETGDLITRDYQRIAAALEEERLRLTAENERQRRDAEQYYTMWAHQAKTPVAAMRLLIQKGGEPAGPAALEAELFRIEQYVDMVLQYQRLESLNADLSFQPFRVEGLVRRAVKNLAPLFIGKGLPLSLEGISGEVVTDSKWFGFVLEQLLTNALKYTKAGSVSVYTQGDDLVIRDTGMGIPPEDLPRVFERGFTGAAGRTERHSTGIGLYLCREISSRLGFSINLVSEQGKGTQVHIGLAKIRPDGWRAVD